MKKILISLVIFSLLTIHCSLFTKPVFAQTGTCPGGPYNQGTICPSPCQTTSTLGGSMIMCTVPSTGGGGNSGFSGNGQITNPALNPSVGSGLGEVIIAKLIAAIINLFFIAGSVAVLVYMLLGGLAWITSEGDKGKMEIAKNRITYAAFGIIIIAASYAVLRLVGAFLGIDFFKDLIIKWPTIT